MNDDSAPAPTPTRDAVIVAGTAFSLASAAFALSVVVQSKPGLVLSLRQDAYYG